VHWGSTGGNIQVKAHNNCSDGATRYLAINVTCREAGMDIYNGIKAEVFPNPTTGELTVKFFAIDGLFYTISVKDITGRILKSEKHKSVLGDNINIFDLSGFTKGIYFVMIEDSEMNQKLKIIVE